MWGGQTGVTLVMLWGQALTGHSAQGEHWRLGPASPGGPLPYCPPVGAAYSLLSFGDLCSVAAEPKPQVTLQASKNCIDEQTTMCLCVRSCL